MRGQTNILSKAIDARILVIESDNEHGRLCQVMTSGKTYGDMMQVRTTPIVLFEMDCTLEE